MVQVTDYTALLSGSTLTGQTGVAAFLSFSFPTTIPAYLYDQYRPDQLTTFRALTAAEQQQARAAIAMIADACGLKFFEVAPGEGDINFMVFDLAQLGNPNAAGFAYYPGNAYGGGEDIYSDVFLTSSAASSMHVLLHEIGHAVGLKHPFDGDINLTAELDNYTNTVMSYTSGGVSGNTLGLLDDDALRYLYGDANADGTQVSAWSWDGTTLTQTGSANAESIFGIGGRDIIQGLGGADLIYGRGGNDQLDGGDGDDQIWGGYGNDVLIGGNGADQLWGEEGADQLSGGIGNDVLYGGDGADVLDGGDGNDTLYGDAGLDVLIGGAGDDNIYDEVSGATLPTVDGGDGTDRLVLTFTDDLARSINTSSAFASIEDITLYLGGGNDVVQLGAASGLVDGGAGNDRIIAGSGFSWLYGGAGADTFVFDAVTSSSSSTRVDQLEDFQTGVDLIDITGASPTSVTLSAASSAYLTANTANGQLSIFVRTAVSLNDVLATRQTGTAGADTLQGTEARDVLVGGGGNDILKGLGSDDTLSGGVGADTLSGGAGADTFIDTAANLSGDTITDWGSTDRIVISDANLSGFSFSLSGNVLSFTGGSLTLTNLPTGSLIASRAAEGGVQIAQFGSGLRDVAGDFNGDGRSDVVLQSSTGALSIWRGQASGALADAGNLNANSLDASWKVAGIGDFNGDGRDDILWRHSSGVIGEWTGQNGVFQNNSGVAANPVDNSWSVVGIADYNGDGRDDILWRHTSGELGQWLAQPNGSFANNGGAAANVVDPTWTVVASGDFNGDGKADILWRHTSGVYAEWQGSATGKLVNVGGVMSGSTSTVVGSGDFNGDGKADVLTRDAAGGAISVWLGQGSGQFTQTFPTQQLGDLNWKIVDIGDFNGDGRADLIWKHSSGVTGEWLGTATGDFVNNGATLTVPVGSTVQSPDIWLV